MPIYITIQLQSVVSEVYRNKRHLANVPGIYFNAVNQGDLIAGVYRLPMDKDRLAGVS